MELRNTAYEPLAMYNSDSCYEGKMMPSFRKKKRFRKKPNNVQLTLPSSDFKPSLPAAQSKLWIVFAALSLIWLVFLTWFALNLHFQSNILKGLLSEVAAGSQGVPDALQKCHSWSRQLQANQTLLFAHLASLSRHLENITSQISVVQNGLIHVEEKLSSSPELINVPHEVQDLSASVASFGSQIKDLQTSFNKIKEEQNNVLTVINSIKTNVTNINNTFSDFTKTYSANNNNKSETTSVKLASFVDGINNKINNVNETISHELQWILADQRKDHMAIEALEEMSANITSRLTTLQNDCVGKLSTVETLSFKANNISNQVMKHNERIDIMHSEISGMVEKMNSVEGSSLKMMSEIADLKNMLPFHRSVEAETVTNNSNIDNLYDPVLHGTNTFLNESENLNNSSSEFAIGNNVKLLNTNETHEADTKE